MKKYGWLLVLLAALVLPGCGRAGGEELPPEPEEGVLIYAALNPVSNALEKICGAF